MRDEREIDDTIKGVDPADAAAVERLPLDDARRELLAGIVSDPEARELEPAAPRRSRPRWRWPVRRSRLALGAAFAGAAATALVVLGIGLGAGGAPSQAFGAALERLARFSPNLLLDIPGWRVEAAYEVGGELGTIHFHRAEKEPESRLGGRLVFYGVESAQLEWKAGKPAASPPPTVVLLGTQPVLGHEARIYVRPARHGASDRWFYAVWSQSGREIEFSSFTDTRRSFDRLLSNLRLVDRDAWLGALAPGGLVTKGGWAASKPWGEPASSAVRVSGCGKALPETVRTGATRSEVQSYEYRCGHWLPPRSRAIGKDPSLTPRVTRCDVSSEELSVNVTDAILKQLEAEGKCSTRYFRPSSPLGDR
jgi:hypothetical protein